MTRERRPSHRIEQLQSTLRRALQQVLARGLNDPRARGMITVTGLTLSQDLREATVLVSVFPHEHESLTMHAVRHAARHIRRQAGELVAMEKVPELHFKLDVSLRKQAEVLDALALVERERERARAGGAESAPDQGTPDEDGAEKRGGEPRADEASDGGRS